MLKYLQSLFTSGICFLLIQYKNRGASLLSRLYYESITCSPSHVSPGPHQDHAPYGLFPEKSREKQTTELWLVVNVKFNTTYSTTTPVLRTVLPQPYYVHTVLPHLYYVQYYHTSTTYSTTTPVLRTVLPHLYYVQYYHTSTTYSTTTPVLCTLY